MISDTSGSLLTQYQYTGQWRSASGLYWYNSRWYDSALGRFVQPDTIVPMATQGVQALDRYAYANNNPVRYNDPSGHMVAEMSDGTNVLLTTRQWSNKEEIGRKLAGLSSVYQYFATSFSFIGATSEIGLTLVGGLFGSAALGWADGLSPVGDFTGGLAGCVVGYGVGHAIHVMYTNPIETGLSMGSTATTVASSPSNLNPGIQVR